MANEPNLKPVFRLSIKAGIAMGPGKAALLRAIDECGSITSAAKAVEMSYRRAWMLVESMNEHFQEPLVEKQRGGHGRGGAAVTPAGRLALRLYEEMQVEAEKAIAKRAGRFAKLLKHP